MSAAVEYRQAALVRGQGSSGGHATSWHTDGSGDAGVYLLGPCTGR